MPKGPIHAMHKLVDAVILDLKPLLQRGQAGWAKIVIFHYLMDDWGGSNDEGYR